MHEIEKFEYKKENLQKIKAFRYGQNWPIVYILEDGKEAYVGESASAYKRAHQHFERAERAKLNNMYVIADDEYNKSATLDIESLLIRYMAGDGKYLLQNSNKGIQESNYYDKERYQSKFEIIWKDLKERHLVDNDLVQIENSDLFKYSPYKVLNDDQLLVVDEILESIKQGIQKSYLISGEPGTGKTIVATFLIKALTIKSWAKELKVGIVIPMTSLRKTLKRVFKFVKGLSPNMVLGPNDVVNQHYDVLIVDEAHRLQRRVNLTNFSSFDIANKALGLDKQKGTQLDWIMKSSKYQVLFYDQLQSIKPADIRPEDINNYTFVQKNLVSQMRVKGGNDYIEYISNILNSQQKGRIEFDNYEIKLFEHITDMVDAIKQKDEDNQIGLSRLLAGFAWKWQTNKKKSAVEYDIVIGDVKLKWNSVTQDWVNSDGAINEVGCIHTIQGYDLNYAGVIIGPEIAYDGEKGEIVVDRSKYMDTNGKRSISDPRELVVYVKNIYKTLLTRGIRGTYVYAVDKGLREYLERFFESGT